MALLGRDTWVMGPFPRGVLLLERLRGRDALASPYRFQIDLLSSKSRLEPGDVLGKPMSVGFRLSNGGERFFHGVVTSFEKTGVTHLHTRYSAELSPRLGLLDHTRDCRIFNEPGQTALSIVTHVLSKRGPADLEAGAVAEHAYRKREYCVQYRESDLNFVQRLLEEEGIYYFFRHDEARHTLVLADSIAAHKAVIGYQSVLYATKERRAASAEEHFWDLKVRRAGRPGRHTVLAGYDPTQVRPQQPQLGRGMPEDQIAGYEFEHYDYPGGLPSREEAQQEAEYRTQIRAADDTEIDVEGNTMGLGVGDLVSLRKGAGDESVPFWSEEDFLKQYLIVEASYSLSIDQYETSRVGKCDEPFRARYRLLGSRAQFRPRRVARKPVMHGPQTALVVGPEGKEIWTDALGRVMVQFDWDRVGARNQKSSCWVRVGQPWAGAKWGAIHVPRIGQEVMVRFLDGDPDRPLIAGQLYNADNLPPYELPVHKTQSGIKSRSSKHGGAGTFNEIRFEDAKGREELHLQAERDMSTAVKHCQTLQVGADRTIVVGHDETNLVHANRDLTVGASDSVVIGGEHDKTVTGTVAQIYSGDHVRKVDGEQEFVALQNKDEHVKQAHTLTTDQKLQLDQGATSLTLQNLDLTVSSAGVIAMLAGGATISIDRTGLVTLDSPSGINLVSGASSLAILPGGVAVGSPAVTAATGGGATLALGSEAAALSGKQVAIEAQQVCSIQGGSKLKLQESDGTSRDS